MNLQEILESIENTQEAVQVVNAIWKKFGNLVLSDLDIDQQEFIDAWVIREQYKGDNEGEAFKKAVREVLELYN